MRVRATYLVLVLVITIPVSSEADIGTAFMGSFTSLRQNLSPILSSSHTSSASEAATSEEILTSAMGPQSTAVILVKFPDKPNTKTRDQISQMVFQNVNDYFREVSYRLIELVGTVTSDWLLLPQSQGHYVGKSYELTLDSLKAADAEVDYRQYRNAVVVIAACDLWPSFAWLGPGHWVTSDGVVSLSVAVVDELSRLGGFAHEIGHMLGLPDLYDYSGKDYVGYWDLMALGAGNCEGTRPAHPTSWSKIKLGWIPQPQILEVHLTWGVRVVVSISPLTLFG